MKISVILPARNEEELVSKTLKELVDCLKGKGVDYEILVVINATSDNTKKIVKDISSRNSYIKVLESAPGYGRALRKGLKNAVGDYIAIFNVDFYDLHFIDLALVDMLGKDLIIGSKRTYWSEDKRTWSRKIITKLFNKYLQLAYGYKGSDTHGIKITRKTVVDKILPKCKTDSGIFDTEFVLKTQRNGFKIADFPVSVSEVRSPRFSGRVMHTPVDIYMLYRALRK